VDDHSWKTFLGDLNVALNAFVRGDAGPYKALWSHTEEISIFGAFGGHERGWTVLATRLDWAAAQYRDGTYADEVLAGPPESMLPTGFTWSV
jgi:hypothetical protein